MKKFFLLIILFISFHLFSTDIFIPGSKIEFKEKRDSLLFIKNLDFSNYDILRPLKKNLFSLKTEKNDTVVIFESEGKPVRIFFRKDLFENTLLEMKIKIFSNYNEKDTVLFYLNEIFNKRKDFYSYSQLIDYIYENYNNSIKEYLEKYFNSYPTNINVLFKNSLVYKDFKDTSKAFEILKKAIPYLDTSEISFNIVGEILFTYHLEKSSLEDLLIFAFDRFYTKDDFPYIVYFAIDMYEEKILSMNFLKHFKMLLNKNISDEIIFLISSFFIDNNYDVENTLKRLQPLYESELYYDYGDWINYYMAKGNLILKRYDQVKQYLQMAEKEFNLNNFEIYRIGFDYAIEVNDKVMLLDYGIKLLSQNMYDKKINDILVKELKLKKTEIRRRVFDFLKVGMDSLSLPEVEVTDLDGKIYKIAEISKKNIKILNFFATWSPYCKKELEVFNLLKEEFKNDKNFDFIAVTSEDDRDRIKDFVKGRKFNFKVYCGGNDLMDSLNLEDIPVILLIDKTGKIRFIKVGYTESILGYVKTRMEFLRSLK